MAHSAGPQLFERLAAVAQSMVRAGAPESGPDGSALVRHQGREHCALSSWVREGVIERVELDLLGYAIHLRGQPLTLHAEATAAAAAGPLDETTILEAAAFFLRRCAVRDRYTQYLLGRISERLQRGAAHPASEEESTAVADFVGQTAPLAAEAQTVIAERRPDLQERTQVEPAPRAPAPTGDHPAPPATPVSRHPPPARRPPVPLWLWIALAISFTAAAAAIWWTS